MTQDFYQERLIASGLTVVMFDEHDIELINRIIYEELVLGIILEDSRKQLQRIIVDRKQQGAEAVILGCTKDWTADPKKGFSFAGV